MIQHVLCKIWRFESKECLVKVSVLCLGVHNLHYRVNVTCGKKAVLTAWRHWKCLDSKRQDADKLQWCAAKCSHCVLMNCANWALTGISFLIAAATALSIGCPSECTFVATFQTTRRQYLLSLVSRAFNTWSDSTISNCVTRKSFLKHNGKSSAHATDWTAWVRLPTAAIAFLPMNTSRPAPKTYSLLL